MLVSSARPPRLREHGFALIELLVVVIIVGLLASVATPVYLNQRKKAVDASIKADLKAVATAAETITADEPTATTFGATQAEIRTAFAAAGFKSSGQNELRISGAPADGFCIIGKNIQGGSALSTHYFWYDSRNGGAPPGPATSAYPLLGGVTCTNPFLIAHNWWTLL